MSTFSMYDLTREERERLAKAAEIIHQHGSLITEALGLFIERMEENEKAMKELAEAGGNGMVSARAAVDLAQNFEHRQLDGKRVMTEIFDVMYPEEEGL